MNIKDMISSSKGGDLSVTYIRGSVTYAESREWTNTINFFDRHDQVSTVDVSNYLELEHSYQSQFGIGITDDGKFFFLHSWKSGLFCFNRETGSLVWRCKRKKPFELVVRDRTVVCRFLDQCVDAFDIDTGDVVAHYPLGFDTIFLPLTDDFYLVGPKRGKYFVLDGDLSVVVTIPYARLNPNLFDTFIVNEANFVAGGISISGFGYSSNAHSIAIRMRTLDEFSEKSRFSRFISIDFPEIV